MSLLILNVQWVFINQMKITILLIFCDTNDDDEGDTGTLSLSSW
jgi:hypothetical protein